MKNDVLILIAFMALTALYPVMCWAHRNVGTALLATLFSPLVILPMGGLIFLVIGGVLKGFNVILESGNIGMTDSTIITISWSATGVAALIGLVFYCRDQRHLSTIKTAPRSGGARVDPQPTLNQRKFMRK